MNAIPPSFAAADARWAALAEAAAVVAALAGIESKPEPLDTPLSELLRASEGWRRVIAENGIADMSAMMEPGIAALLAVNAHGADPRPAAGVLWQEYCAARDAVMAVLTSPTTAS